MKRFFSLLLVALLLCTAAVPAMADDGYAVANLEAFADMMDAADYSYEWSDDGKYIKSKFTIDCALEKCEVYVWGYARGLKVQARIPYEVMKRDMEELAIFSMMMNNKLLVGEFAMNFESGYFGYEVFCLGYDHVISQTDLEYALTIAVSMLEDYGDGIMAITDSHYTAEEAFALYF